MCYNVIDYRFLIIRGVICQKIRQTAITAKDLIPKIRQPAIAAGNNEINTSRIIETVETEPRICGDEEI